ncbi:MAG TPA: DsbA family protein [Caulobacteraceae bacterium]
MRLFNRRTALVIAASALLAACNGGGAGKASTEDMTLGNPDAKVTVTEVASASCAHCARWNEEVWPAFKAKYVDTGKVHYVMKEFLTPPVDLAAAAFLTARCAGKDKYFNVVDAVFRAQGTIYQTGDARGELLRIAKSAGLSEDEFNACVRDEDALKALNARVEKTAKELDVTGTPTFFVNGKKVADGETPLEALDKAIAEAEGAAK